MDCSVVIPTYNRAALLARTLAALGGQVGGVSHEVIVVDDGSTDSTRAVVESARTGFPVGLSYLWQQNRKQGAARNLGAACAQGDFLIFLGDDTAPAEDFLLNHDEARRRRNESNPDSKLVVIGYTPWATHLKRTRFMEYIGERGWQFGFSLIQDCEDVPFNFFYTSNLSIGRRFFRGAGGFDEDFQEYGWEDVELSVRLKSEGMRIVYQPAAVAFHDHPTSLISFTRRQRKVGLSAWRFYRKHPSMADFLSILKVRRYSLGERLRLTLLTAACALSEKNNRPDLTRYYPDLMTYYYNLGILEGQNDKA